MMKKKEIEHTIKKNCQQLDKSICKLEKMSGKKAIHHFRVEIKKFRSFLRLLSSGRDKDAGLKLPKKLKQVYTLTGMIRNLQLQLQRIKVTDKENHTLSEYTLCLKRVMKNQVKKLQTLLEKKPLAGIKKKITPYLPSVLPAETVKKFFQVKSDSINAVLSNNVVTDNDLHNIRKNIKDLIHICKEFKDKNNMPVPAICNNKTELTGAENTEQELGQVIDLCIALELTSPAWLNKISPDEKKRLQVIRKQWFAEKKEISEKLIGILHTRSILDNLN